MVFDEILMMSLGYLVSINAIKNNYKQVNNYLERSFDKLQNLQKNEGQFIDIIINWLHNFGRYLNILLARQDLHTYVEIFQIGLDNVIKKNPKQIRHDRIYCYYTLGQCYYYANDFKRSVDCFYQALKIFNEYSDSLKAHFGTFKTSNYLEKRERYIKFKLKEM